MPPRTEIRADHRWVISLMLLLAALIGLSACGSVLEETEKTVTPAPTAPPPKAIHGSAGSPGIGGTGEVAGDGNGIGGTGTYAGTPGIGGTGIIGTITAFGSIFVNGYEIDYAPGLAIAHKDGGRRPDDLRVGQVVAVEADGEGSRLRARSIAVRHEVAGPVESIDRASRTLTVMGQRVSLSEEAAASLSLDEIKTGQIIDVSGSRRADGVILASRLDASAPGALAMVRGRTTAVDSSGFLVNGLRVASPAGQRPAGLNSGQEVVISGVPSGGGLRARRIALDPQTPFRGRVSRLSIEGFSRANRDGSTTIGGVRLRRLPGAGQAAGNERVIMEGSLDRSGRFQPARVRPHRLRLQPRRQLQRAPDLIRPRAEQPAIRTTPRATRITPPADRPRVRRQPVQPRVWRPRPLPRWRDRPLRRQRR